MNYRILTLISLIALCGLSQIGSASDCGCYQSGEHLVKIHVINPEGYYSINKTVTVSEGEMDYSVIIFPFRLLTHLWYVANCSTSKSYVTDINGDVTLQLKDDLHYFICIDGTETLVNNAENHYIIVTRGIS